MGSDEEIAFPDQEIAFPVWKSEIPHRKSRFPCGKGKIRAGNHVSGAGKAKSHAGNCFSRAGKAKSRAGNHVSRAGKAKSHAGNCFSRAGKAKFHAGIPFTCVSALANTITIVGSSCLGRKFRLDEPQRKKDFRKRTLQDVVPAPPSVKDQAFDQQCIEEHHEWRRNDPPA